MRLLLASTSAARQAMLAAAGVTVEALPPAIDEDALKAAALARASGPAEIAAHLAREKALSLAAPGCVVIGADQTMSVDGELRNKAADLAALRRQLLDLRGRSHDLISVVAVAGEGELWICPALATLTMRAFSEAFLDRYLERNGERVLSSLGGYHFEGEGAQLFEEVDGDHSTILGLPLLPLLGRLRELGALPT